MRGGAHVATPAAARPCACCLPCVGASQPSSSSSLAAHPARLSSPAAVIRTVPLSPLADTAVQPQRRTGGRTARRARRAALCTLGALGLLAAAPVYAAHVAAAGSAPPGTRELPGGSAALAPLLLRRARLEASSARRRRAPAVDHSFDLGITAPQSCTPMNITFNPSKGVPPFTVQIAPAGWFPAVFSVPATYADPALSQWLVQYTPPVYSMPDAPSSSKLTPDMIVSVVDSTGAMANSSSMVSVKAAPDGISCAPISGTLPFFFYNDPSQTTCEPFHVAWNSTSGNKTWSDPLGLYFLPQRLPPLYMPISNSSALNMTFPLAVPASTDFLMTMADAKGASGGVSGRNSAGFSEYSDLSCLQRPSSGLLPTPTATLTYPMPDYVASVPSLTTSNGVVYTQTVVATVRNGKGVGSHGPDGGVLGASVGVGIAAALGACLVFYILWRRRQKRRELSWDVPDGVASTLGHSGAPIDRKFAQRLTPQTGGGQLRHGGAALAAAGEMPGNRSSRANSVHSSLHSFGGSAYELRADYHAVAPLDSPGLHGGYAHHQPHSPPGSAPLPYSDFSPPSHYASTGGGDGSFAPSSLRLNNDSQDQEVLSQMSPQQMAAQRGSHYGARRASASSGSMRAGGAAGAGAYRSPFGNASGDLGSGRYEEVPMSEPRYPASSIGSTSGGGVGTYNTTTTGGTPNSAAHAYTGGMSRTESSGSSSSAGGPFSNSRRVPASALGGLPHPHRTSSGSSASAYAMPLVAAATPPRAGYGFVQHSDAGLLMDDSIGDAEDEEDAARHGIVELPPQYDAVPRRQPRGGSGSSIGGAQQQQTTSTTASGALAAAGTRSAASPGSEAANVSQPSSVAPASAAQPPENAADDDDEAEFWRPVPAPSSSRG